MSKRPQSLLQGGLNQNICLAHDEVALESLVCFLNQLRLLKDYDLVRLNRPDSLRSYYQTQESAKATSPYKTNFIDSSP